MSGLLAAQQVNRMELRGDGCGCILAACGRTHRLRREATMKALGISLVVLAMAVLMGAGCMTTGAKKDCPRCHMPAECCTCDAPK